MSVAMPGSPPPWLQKGSPGRVVVRLQHSALPRCCSDSSRLQAGDDPRAFGDLTGDVDRGLVGSHDLGVYDVEVGGSDLFSARVDQVAALEEHLLGLERLR